MKPSLPSRYTGAIAFALNPPANQSRELYSPRLHLHVQPAPAGRPQFAGKVYLEAYEKVPGGVVFLNWWAPANRTGVREILPGPRRTSRGESLPPALPAGPELRRHDRCTGPPCL